MNSSTGNHQIQARHVLKKQKSLRLFSSFSLINWKSIALAREAKLWHEITSRLKCFLALTLTRNSDQLTLQARRDGGKGAQMSGGSSDRRGMLKGAGAGCRGIWSRCLLARGCLSLKLFRACPTDRRPRVSPGTCSGDYISLLAWERLGIPQEELENASRGKGMDLHPDRLWLKLDWSWWVRLK